MRTYNRQAQLCVNVYVMCNTKSTDTIPINDETIRNKMLSTIIITLHARTAVGIPIPLIRMSTILLPAYIVPL